MDLLAAIDALDDAVHLARRVPPLTDGASMKPDRLRALLADIRAALPDDPELRAAMTERLEAVESIVAGARPVPLVNRVRIPMDVFYERLDELRDLIPRRR